MSNISNPIEKIGKAGIRKGFINESQFQQAQTMAKKHPEISFMDLLEKLGFITAIQKKELQDFLNDYDSMLANLPSLPDENEVEEESVMLTPLEDEETETETDGLLLVTNTNSSSMMLVPEPETIIAEASLKFTPQEITLLPEAATLPTFFELLNHLPSIPLEEKFCFSHKEDEDFSKHAIDKNLLSRETIEVLLEMQKNLKKMEVHLPIVQLVKEFNYMDEGLIKTIQKQLNCQSTLIKSYTLPKAENQTISQKAHILFAKEMLTEAKKVQEYFGRLTLEKSLGEVLLIQGYYEPGAIYKLPTGGSRISSLRKSSKLTSATRTSSVLRRSSSSKKRR